MDITAIEDSIRDTTAALEIEMDADDFVADLILCSGCQVHFQLEDEGVSSLLKKCKTCFGQMTEDLESGLEIVSPEKPPVETDVAEEVGGNQPELTS